MFAELKHQFRKAAARTHNGVCAATGALLGTYTPEECVNNFRNSGYRRT